MPRKAMKCNSCVVVCRALQVREGADRVVEEHDAEAGDDHVEGLGGEGVGLRVCEDEASGGACLLGALSGGGDAGAARYRCRCWCRLRRVSRATASVVLPDAAADVEDMVRAPVGNSLDEQILEGLKHLVEKRLGVDPGASGGAVPQRCLVAACLTWRTHDRLHTLACATGWLHSATSSPLEVKRVKDLDISEVAKRSGFSASALRFYEEKGLIASVGRRGLRRTFDPAVLQRLALIAVGRASGFTVDEMARMFNGDGKPRIDRRLLAAKAEELDKTIRELGAMRDGLRHAAACRAPSHMECPTFKRLLRAAGKGAIGRRRRVA